MDFFARQDHARRNTKLLVFYFCVAVVLIVLSVYLTCVFIFNGVNHSQRHGVAPAFRLWQPQLFLISAGCTLVVIVSGSLFKIAALASGGSAVAESLGGRLINATTQDAHERKLLNVVEEMSIASGVPMPKVYVMDKEMGINAFAAGHNLSDAAIGVTRGCIASLTRDELQGVIAHEYSHILNGDMSLNLRLMGIIFGILCLAVIGRQLLWARSSSSRDKNPLPLLGIVLILLGWLGVFFGRLIQAAVSRQREFLADAAAVQFTRNPDGLAGALKKIGAAQFGSQMQNAHAAEASHMFFGSALKASFINAFATHPPLEQRIRAIDAAWDGKFTAEDSVRTAKLRSPAPRPTTSTKPPVLPGFGGRSAAILGATVQAQAVMTQIGAPTNQHLRYAVELRESLPEQVRLAAMEPDGACAILLAMLLAPRGELRERQLRELQNRIPAGQLQQIRGLGNLIMDIANRARLPLVNLALPALRDLSPEGYQTFKTNLQWLIASDNKVVLAEFVLEKIIQRQVEPHFARQAAPAIQYYSAAPLAPDFAILLSALAHTGQSDSTAIKLAFDAGVRLLRITDRQIELQPAERAGLTEIGSALDRLSLAAPQIKRNLLAACVQVVSADGIVQENEAELLRGIAETLDCPMPPFLPAA